MGVIWLASALFYEANGAQQLPAADVRSPRLVRDMPTLIKTR